MKQSNIIAASNLYYFSGENPLFDKEFVENILDYKLLAELRRLGTSDYRFQHLNPMQEAIVERETRCIYAKGDPCWGLAKDKNKVVCACINGKCPQIRKCNPDYTSEDEAYWKTNDESYLYGDPSELKKYYRVDLVSDQETLRYQSDPKEAGLEFHPMPNTIEKERAENFARKPVVVGYEKIYFGDADDQLSPIYGFVDDAAEPEPIAGGLYGSAKRYVHSNANTIDENMRQKQALPSEKTTHTVAQDNITEPLLTARKGTYERAVKGKIVGKYVLTELSDEKIKQLASDEFLSIILSNEAEMAYVSGLLHQSNIEHSIETLAAKRDVCLWKADTNLPIEIGGNVFVSSEFLRRGCMAQNEKMWELLGKIQDKITELSVLGRDFFGFVTLNGETRWGCRNLYGATHIAVRLDDLELDEIPGKEQAIKLVNENDDYTVYCSDGVQIGRTSDSFKVMLESLKSSKEILEFPRLVSGVILSKCDGKLCLKGIGHMKFDEY